MTVTVGTHAFRTDPANVDFLVELVNDYYALDNYVFHSYRNADTDGARVDMIGLQLDDPTHALLDSTALTSTPPDLALWQQWFGLDINGGTGESRFMLRGTVQSVEPAHACAERAPASRRARSNPPRYPDDDTATPRSPCLSAPSPRQRGLREHNGRLGG